jgi:hypothetical protein
MKYLRMCWPNIGTGGWYPVGRGFSFTKVGPGRKHREGYN